VQRRDLITGLIGAAAVLVPAPALAQAKVPRLGYLWIGAEGTDGPTLGGLRAGLSRSLRRLASLCHPRCSPPPTR